MKKTIDWKEILKNLNEKFGVPIVQHVEWSSPDRFGLWLPFMGLKDLDNTMKHLVLWRDFYCFRYRHDDHKYDKRTFEYFPIEQEIVLRPKTTDLPRDRHIVGIKFKIGIRYLDEKSS